MKLLLSNSLKIKRLLFKKLRPDVKDKILDSFQARIVDPNSCVAKTNHSCKKVKNNPRACYSCQFSVKEINTIKKSPKFVMLPRGDIKLIGEIFLDFDIVDKTVLPKVKHPVKFLWDKLPDAEKGKAQKAAAEKWSSYGYGQLQAPPRSGKSVILSAISLSYKTRVAIFAHQRELIDQFYKTFMSFTNIKRLQKETGKTLIKINPKSNEIDDLTICLYTYQSFISDNGKKRLAKVVKKFGFIGIDEVHRTPAKCFSEVIRSFKSRYIAGVTATPERKDGMHFISNLIIGPVVVEALSEQLPCRVRVLKTNRPIPAKTWTGIINKLSKDKVRDKYIIKQLKFDFKNKHKVVIPIERVEHAYELCCLARKEYGDEGKRIEHVTGKTPKWARDKIITDAKAGKVDVLIATRKIISLGLDIPPFSCLYEVMPIANKHNYYQEVSRIRTPNKNKPTPVVKIFLDSAKVSNACFNIIDKVNKELGFVYEDKGNQVSKKGCSAVAKSWNHI